MSNASSGLTTRSTGEVTMALWLVATPIGTLSDLSPRARQILGALRRDGARCGANRHAQEERGHGNQSRHGHSLQQKVWR